MLHTLILLTLSSSSLGTDVTLSSANDFTNFVNRVNLGNDYSGTTVYLGSDITLTGNVDPIGTYGNNFRGVFDGQGHIISNLRISSSSSQYIGLFGYSHGLTIRNVVLNRYCSITSLYSSSGWVHVGGIVGYCYASSGECNIENSVNIADVTFSGNISGGLRAVGIVGTLHSSSSHSAYVKNCVNYGSVIHAGVSSYWAVLGGIVGYSQGYSYNAYIQNCLNYGTITHSGTTARILYIGGVVGYSYNNTHIENCVSVGTIARQTTVSNNCIGSIVGYIDYSNIHINYCYFTNDVGASSIYSCSYYAPSTTGNGYYASVNSNLVSSLNNIATRYKWSKWLLNTNNATVTFKMSDNKELSFSSQIILVPDPVKKENSFLFWCKDAECTEEFDPTTESVSETTVLYAAWVNNTVAFDVNGGNDLTEDKVTKIVTFDKEYGDLPEPNKTGYIFIGWFTEKNENVSNGKIVKIPKNHTLHAHWTVNIYNVTFNVSGGNDLPEDKATKIVTFDKEYGDLPEPNRTGYTFLGWVNEKNENVSNKKIVKIPKNHTLYANWTANIYTVTFNVSGGNDLPEDKATKTVTFDEEYGDLPEPNRTGYAFAGWLDGDNESATNETIVKTPKNHALYANWAANTYTVALDADGGGGVPTLRLVVFDSAYGKLPEPNRTGYAFAGWFTETPGGDPVNSSTIVASPYDHKIYAHWTATQRVITFDFGNGKTMTNIQSYGDAIIYPSEVPSKSFHKFRGWCTKDVIANSDKCNVTHVPANDLTFTASFDAESSLVAGFSIAVVSMVLVVILLVVLLIFVIMRKTGRNYEPVGIELDEENDEKTANRTSERVGKRIFQQVESMKISNSFAKSLKNSFKKAEKNKGLDEILVGLGVECEDDKSDDVIESFRTTAAVQTSIASSAHKKENLVATAEYLRLLYTTAREQEEYEEFAELYFGMKNIGNFTDKMDEETISFGGVVSGFTSKRKVIQSLMSRNEKDEKKKSNSMPSGVLFKVKKGRGYKIGKIDEETDEVLLEVNSMFKVEAVREVTKDRFLVVALSFVSPVTENELIKM